MLIFIDINSFIPVSVCVGRGPSALLWPGAYNAVKMALISETRQLIKPVFSDHLSYVTLFQCCLWSYIRQVWL